LLAGHRTVRVLWFDDSDRGATVQEATATAGGVPSAGHTLEPGSSAGALMDASVGPGGHLWTLTDNGDGAKCAWPRTGPLWPARRSLCSRLCPIGLRRWCGRDRRTKSGQPELPGRLCLANRGGLDGLTPPVGHVSVGYAPGLTQTAAGLRLSRPRQRVLPAGGFAWTGHGFAEASPIGDTATALPTALTPAATRAGASLTYQRVRMITVDQHAHLLSRRIFRSRLRAPLLVVAPS